MIHCDSTWMIFHLIAFFGCLIGIAVTLRFK